MAKIPRARQTLLFSATFPAEIEPLAQQALVDPVRVEVAPTASTPDAVEQTLYFVDQKDKRALLHDLLGNDAVTRAIVFTRTKHRADRVARQLVSGEIHAAAIHGDKAQGARERALERFRQGSLRVLVATDIAARGIDVEGISHVINYDLPNDPEAYVHRIGRTARAGMGGMAVSFCSADEHTRLASIERLTRRRVPVIEGHAYTSAESTPPPETRKPIGAPAAPRGHGARRSHGAPRRR
jgi:ATP-dependent RNA helicase RhlE